MCLSHSQGEGQTRENGEDETAGATSQGVCVTLVLLILFFGLYSVAWLLCVTEWLFLPSSFFTFFITLTVGSHISETSEALAIKFDMVTSYYSYLL